MKKLLFAFGCFLLAGTGVRAQVVFSLATDFSLMHNNSPLQRFWAPGQTVQVNAHFSRKEAAYAWINYFTQGKFHNTWTSDARSPLTVPASINYRITSKWKPTQISIGWKHYLKGDFDNEASWSLYGTAGFGLLFLHVDNSYDPALDSAGYYIPTYPAQGTITIKKLTFDLGLGGEMPIGGDLYLYGEVRTWLPASDKTSPYFISNKNVPLPVIASIGLRVLFSYDY